MKNLDKAPENCKGWIKKFKDSNYKLSLEKTSLQREVLKLRKINKKNQTEMEKQVKKNINS